MAANMPMGVRVAPLWRRAVAWIIDALVPALLTVAWVMLQPSLDGSQVIVASIVAGLIGLAWFVGLWWAYGVRGAGPGYLAMGLQLVGLADGQPIGWGRWIVRQLVFGAVAGTGLGWIALLIFLVIQERRQGWHDLAAKAVAIETVKAASIVPPRVASGVNRAHATTVALPPHLLATAFDGSASGSTGRSSYGDSAHGQNTHGQNTSGQNAYGQNTYGQSPVGQPSSAQSHQGQIAPGVREETGWQPPPRPGSAPAPAGWGAPAASAATGASSSGSQGSIPVAATPAPVPATPAPPDVTSVRVVAREPEPADDEYGTRLVPSRAQVSARPGNEGWFLQLDDGRQVPVESTVLIGRHPSQPHDGTTATLVPIGEGGQAVSKLHVAVGVDVRGVHITDLGSTNGTAVVASNGELEPCQPGVQTRVREGQTVSFGDRSLVVMRTPAAQHG